MVARRRPRGALPSRLEHGGGHSRRALAGRRHEEGGSGPADDGEGSDVEKAWPAPVKPDLEVGEQIRAGRRWGGRRRRGGMAAPVMPNPEVGEAHGGLDRSDSAGRCEEPLEGRRPRRTG
ncbi:hypothetical protein U9M48_042462 [Paspalum notatum var. saurae]|uniref:Uncharacterized protein n=1 Tax=Paspalum notatum var. saurae TaxID=547442 RepID=A0AAQ3XG67_PASNO